MHFSERKTDFRDAWPQWVQKEKNGGLTGVVVVRRPGLKPWFG